MKKLEKFREFFSELLNVNSTSDPSVANALQPATISYAEKVRQEKSPTIVEVQMALKQMKSGKAPGNDEITADLLKLGGVPMLKWLYRVFVEIWKTEQMIEDWSLAILIRLFKNKGDKKICDNYRGIFLLVVTKKLFSRVVLNRIQTIVDEQLLERQAGFRANRSTIEQIFSLRIVMEKYKEYNKPLHMCFIDIQKAYDSVNRDLLWKICKSYGLTDKIVNLLKMLRNNSKAKVRINGQLSDSFDIETGVMQGEIPSPFLFDIFFDFIIRKVLEEAGILGMKLAYGSSNFYHGKSEKYDLFDILVLMYADDLMALRNSLQDLEKFILTYEIITQKYGLTMSVKKTVIMSMEEFETDSNGKVIKQKEIHHPDPNIVIRNQKLEIIDKLTYLGCGVFRD